MERRSLLGSFAALAAVIVVNGSAMAGDGRTTGIADYGVPSPSAAVSTDSVAGSVVLIGSFVVVPGAIGTSVIDTGESETWAMVANFEPAVSCTPGYRPCIPNKPSDVDCRGGSGNGPRYTRAGVVYSVRRGYDRYRLDADRDGKGCE